MVYHLPLPSADTIFWGALGIGTILVGCILIGWEAFSRLQAKRRVTPRPTVKKGTRAFDFVVESTTDWFALGIEHGQLEAILSTDASEGTIREGDPDLLENKFNINQTSPKLKAKVVARFRITAVWESLMRFDRDYPYSITCFAEKGNLGTLRIQVFDHESQTFLGEAQYQRTDAPKNLMQFIIELREHGLMKALKESHGGTTAWTDSQPRLEITLTNLNNDEEEVENVEIWLKHKDKRIHPARFCFITIRNTAVVTAKNVTLSCGHHMIVMPFKGKRDYRVEHEWDRVEDFDEEVRNPAVGVEAYVLATLDGFDDNISIPAIHGGEEERVVLFFTMKDFPAFCVPCHTRNYYNPRGSPPTQSLVLNVHHDDALGGYTTWFEVVMYSWENFIPKLLKTKFTPYSGV